MGIIVPDAVLPNGIQVSNVYMCFADEPVYTQKNSNIFYLNSSYRIYKTSDKTPDVPIRFPISTQVTDIEGQSSYSILYDALKKIYPGSEDSLVNYVPPVPQEPVFQEPVVSYVSSDYGEPTLTSNVISG